LLPPVLLIKYVPFERRDIVPILLLGVAQFGILIALLNIGLQSVPSARAALIFATFPILTMVFGAALGRERLTMAKAVGVLLTFAGVAFVLSQKLQAGGNSSGGWTGELAIFASAGCGAVCSVFYGPYVRKYPTTQVSVLAMAAAVVFLGALAVAEQRFGAPARLTGDGWLAVLFIGVSSGVGYSLWLWAIGHSTPTRVAAFLALSPVTASILGALLLNEPITLRALIGFACVASGLMLAHLGQESRAQSEPKARLADEAYL
jgi:drug/metabolite transporter (DMT)-like permease